MLLISFTSDSTSKTSATFRNVELRESNSYLTGCRRRNREQVFERTLTASRCHLTLLRRETLKFAVVGVVVAVVVVAATAVVVLRAESETNSIQRVNQRKCQVTKMELVATCSFEL